MEVKAEKAVKATRAITGAREDKGGKEETKVRYLALVLGETCRRTPTSTAASALSS